MAAAEQSTGRLTIGKNRRSEQKKKPQDEAAAALSLDRELNSSLQINFRIYNCQNIPAPGSPAFPYPLTHWSDRTGIRSDP